MTLTVISLGGGVQSSTMAIMAANGKLKPMPDAAIFADTQDEPRSVYDWLGWLEPLLPFPLYRVTRGRLSEHMLEMHVTRDGRMYSRTMLPTFTKNIDGSIGKIVHRGCTRDYKINPITRKIRELISKDAFRLWRHKHQDALSALRYAAKNKLVKPLDAWRECQDDALVHQWIGISMDEMRRAKPSRDPWSKHTYPLLEARIHRRDCIEWMRSNGYPEPPRSACVYCPFHDNTEWRRLQTTEAAEFAKAVAFERKLQQAKSRSANFISTPFLHRSCQPLDTIDFRSDVERGQGVLWDDECEGMCGV